MLRSCRPLLGAARKLQARGNPAARLIQASPPYARHGKTFAMFPLVAARTFASKSLNQTGTDEVLVRQPVQKKPDARSEPVSRHPTTKNQAATGVTEGAAATKEVREEVGGSVDRRLKQDIKVARDTFRLDQVPRESLVLGAAGTLPYLATSMSTVYLSWNLNTQWPTDSDLINSIMVFNETAEWLLGHLETLQMGYGAVIISFLGAIHWGLEYAETSASRPRTTFRYSMGVIAPAVAWPTMMLPIEWSLTTQFLAFTFLFLADSRATSRGWAPQWYGLYRWVLTAIVGSSIVISLIGRQKIGGRRARAADLGQTMAYKQSVRRMPESQWTKLEAKEKQKIQEEEDEKEKQRVADEARRAEKEKKRRVQEKDERDVGDVKAEKAETKGGERKD